MTTILYFKAKKEGGLGLVNGKIAYAISTTSYTFTSSKGNMGKVVTAKQMSCFKVYIVPVPTRKSPPFLPKVS